MRQVLICEQGKSNVQCWVLEKCKLVSVFAVKLASQMIWLSLASVFIFLSSKVAVSKLISTSWKVVCPLNGS